MEVASNMESEQVLIKLEISNAVERLQQADVRKSAMYLPSVVCLFTHSSFLVVIETAGILAHNHWLPERIGKEHSPED